jgi:hypothetical protein
MRVALEEKDMASNVARTPREISVRLDCPFTKAILFHMRGLPQIVSRVPLR